MGMFDYIRCEYPLPDGFRGELQTKDTEPQYLVEHLITREGRFMECVLLRVEEVPKAERPYPDAPDDSLESFIGSQRSVTEMRDANFHGVLNFYGHEGDQNTMHEPGSDYVWHEYNAKFTDGQLVEIAQVQS